MPAIIISALAGSLMPSGSTKNALLGCFIPLAVICLCSSCVFISIKKEFLQRNRLALGSSHIFFRRLDQQYFALKEDENDNISEIKAVEDKVEHKIDIDLNKPLL